jgi:membrane-bound serine protease (ClpP class)
VEVRVADLLASDREDLLRKLDGRRLPRQNGETVLRTAGAERVVHGMTTAERILHTISNPNVAYILMMLGLLGLFFELSTPGAILPGVVGAISLLLAFFAFQALPVNYAGMLLILLALVLFVLEVKVVSYGMLTVGGIIVMALGSLLLFESAEPWLRVSRTLIAITVLIVAAFSAFAVSRAIKAHRHRPETGREGLVGETGVADSDIDPEGKVVVHGEYWNAWSEERIARGERIRVVDLEGLRLKVTKL